MIKGKLISNQRYPDKAKVAERVIRFKRLIVSVYPAILRGQQYTILMDGRHNYAAAMFAGVDPGYRPIDKKVMEIISTLGEQEGGAFFINNVTGSDYYFVENGQVVKELLLPDISCRFQAHANNQWIFGGWLWPADLNSGACAALNRIWHGGNLKLNIVRCECSNRQTKLLNSEV